MVNKEVFSRDVVPNRNSDSVDDTQESIDTIKANVPSFIMKIVKSPFDSRPEALNNDITYFLYKDSLINPSISPVVGSLFRSFIDHSMEIVHTYSSHVDEINTFSFSSKVNETAVCIGLYRSMVSATSMSELRKGQVLVGSPTLHAPVSKVGHPVYDEIPSSFFSFDWSNCDELGREVQAITGMKRADKFTLPLTTSQGIMLKGVSETVEQRVRAKALLSAIALKCQSLTELNIAMGLVGEAFTDKGFMDLSKAFYVGMRKQAARKIEPIQDENGDTVGYSNALQGRVRAIFPCTEDKKVMFKPLADGLKKALFTQSEGFSVDSRIIARDSIICGALTLAFGLFDPVEENLAPDGLQSSFKSLKIPMPKTFYDLSAFDTTQHAGLNDLVYLEFLRGCFSDIDDKEETMCSIADLLFPLSPRSDDLLLQRVNGWSTMSGQPDVTVKNNVIHFMVMVKAIKAAIDMGYSNPDSLFYKLDEFSETKIIQAILKQNDFIVSKVHGDDTVLCFSPYIIDQENYLISLEATGLRYGLEYGFSYLKKFPTEHRIEKAIKIIQDQGFDNKRISIAQWRILLSKLRKDVAAEMNVLEIPQIFNSVDAPMMPVIGSLMKNRFGEYPNEFVGSFLIGMIDVISLAISSNQSGYLLSALLAEATQLMDLLSQDDHYSAEGQLLKQRMLATSEEEFKTSYLEALFIIIESLELLVEMKKTGPVLRRANASKIFSELNLVKNTLAQMFGEIMQSRMDLADSLRDQLSRMYYSSFQDEESAFDNNEFFAELYGMLSYSPEEEVVNYGFYNKSLEELVATAYKWQSVLIANNGDWNAVS